MSRRARRHGSGDRTGQHHNAAPALRSYSQPPAGPVTITRPDGTVEVEAPQKAVRDVPKKPRRKALGQKKPPPLPTMEQLLTVECPACGREPGQPCTLRQGHRARVEMYRASTGQGSSPEAVRVVVQKGAEVLEDKRAARRTVTPEERAKRAAQSAAAKEATRRKGSRGNPYKSANTRAASPEQVTALRCPACGAPSR
ncbi:hypothetical protein AB0K80_31520 [Streptomyces sp. NPDC052682]|uniref:zinc finger domain-containing protein n=1 Tax=Streptomyces sp. NPDC052682 TaxID=3154954 RepID=UPI00343B892B